MLRRSRYFAILGTKRVVFIDSRHLAAARVSQFSAAVLVDWYTSPVF
jgi:hypothetical protein